MSLLTWPAALLPESFQLSMVANQRVFSSPFGGSEQVVDLLNDRWSATITLPVENASTAAAYEAFFNSLRGALNTVGIWHMARPAPQGTMRGTPTLNATAAAGTQSLVINTTTGATLKAGDMLGVGGMLVQVAADATAVGTVITATIVNALRKGVASGQAVTWDKPKAPFRLASVPAYGYGVAIADGFSIDLVEAI